MAMGMAGSLSAEDSALPDAVSFEPGPVNAVSIRTDAGDVGVYRGLKGRSPHSLLLTHARRDVVEAARDSVEADTEIIAPELSREALEQAEQHWQDWWDERFDYYGQEVTRLPVRSFPASRYVKDGDEIEIGGRKFTALATPGVTLDGVTFLTGIDGRRLAFTGNLLWEGGRVFDLYSFQNAIREAKIGAYHGYLGRLGPWIESLKKLSDAAPDVLVPSRGPLIRDPRGDIENAIARARAIYRNYISTNALHWYFGEERMRTAFEMVMGKGEPMESMPLAQHVDLPDWCRHIGTTKLLLSKEGAGFVLDVGGKASLDGLKQVLADGLVTGIEGIWVTHLHNDHTKAVAEAQREFGCPVYAVRQVAGALMRPGEFFTPGLTSNAVDEVTILKDGEKIKWREYDFTARYFPGQMRAHGGLLVEKPDHDPVFFIGDSFSPSGIDDYCLMNRNLMREDEGYLRGFRILREETPAKTWLVNQHIPHLFRFSEKELDWLEGCYRERIKMIAEFIPWDDVNFAIDEQWSWTFPYGQEVKAGQEFEITLQIENHSQREREFGVTVHGAPGVFLTKEEGLTIKVGPRQKGSVEVKASVSPEIGPGVKVVTFSLKGDDFQLPHWCEALIRVAQ